MANKTKTPKKIVAAKGAERFCVGVNEDFTTMPVPVDKQSTEKKRTYTGDDDYIYEPKASDMAKFRDMSFASNLVADIDRKQVEAELRGWGIDFDLWLLLNDPSSTPDDGQCTILNDYIDQNADYVSLTIVDILAVIMGRCEFEWVRFATILNDANYDLLKLELASRFHCKADVGNAAAFVSFEDKHAT